MCTHATFALPLCVSFALYLAAHGLTGEDMTVLAEALEGSDSLTDVNLSGQRRPLSFMRNVVEDRDYNCVVSAPVQTTCLAKLASPRWSAWPQRRRS